MFQQYGEYGMSSLQGQVSTLKALYELYKRDKLPNLYRQPISLYRTGELIEDTDSFQKEVYPLFKLVGIEAHWVEYVDESELSEDAYDLVSEFMVFINENTHFDGRVMVLSINNSDILEAYQLFPERILNELEHFFNYDDSYEICNCTYAYLDGVKDTELRGEMNKAADELGELVHSNQGIHIKLSAEDTEKVYVKIFSFIEDIIEYCKRVVINKEVD
jgi:hypothetical protein